MVPNYFYKPLKSAPNLNLFQVIFYNDIRIMFRELRYQNLKMHLAQLVHLKHKHIYMIKDMFDIYLIENFFKLMEYKI